MLKGDGAVPYSIAAGAIFPPLCSIIVCLRFYVRCTQDAKVGWDDWLTVPALALLTVMSAAILTGVALNAVGYPTESPATIAPGTHNANQQEVVRAISWSIELMYFPALGFIKLSVLLFYRRIFGSSEGTRFKILSKSIIVLIIIWILGFFLSYLFGCSPHTSYYWTSIAKREHNCVDQGKLHLSYAISDVILNNIIILMPIPLIWQLHIMSRWKRFGVVTVFTLGALSITTSIARLIIFVGRLAHVKSWQRRGIYWCIVEVGIGLIAACLPPLYRIFKIKAVNNAVRRIRKMSWLQPKVAPFESQHM